MPLMGPLSIPQMFDMLTDTYSYVLVLNQLISFMSFLYQEHALLEILSSEAKLTVLGSLRLI